MFDQQGRRKYLNWPEREAFFQAVKVDPDPANRAFCLTLFYTGCRITEALNLTPNNLDRSENAVVFATLKRRKEHYRSVPVPETLMPLLAELSSEETPEVRLWSMSRTTGYRLVKHHMKGAGLTGTKACPKGLRHAYAHACLSRGIPLPTVQKWLGHASLETTAIYLDMVGDEERELAKLLWRTI